MRKTIISLLLAFLLAATVCGTELETLEEGLPEEAEEIMPEIHDADFWGGLKELILSGLSGTGDSLKSGLKLCGILLGIALLCSVVDFSSLSGYGGAVSVAGSLGICGAFLGTAQAMTGLATDTVQKMSDYSACMPVSYTHLTLPTKA